MLTGKHAAVLGHSVAGAPVMGTTGRIPRDKISFSG
jgi:hypothetical protein